MWKPNYTIFCVGCRNWIAFSAGVSKLTWFQCRYRSKLVFLCRGIKIGLNSEWESNSTWFQWRGEIDYFWCRGSNFARFLCEWSKVTRLQSRCLNFTWFQGLDRNWPGVLCGVEKDLVLVWGSKLTCFLCWAIEIDFISEWASNWLHFTGGFEINYFLCRGSKLTVCGP